MKSCAKGNNFERINVGVLTASMLETNDDAHPLRVPHHSVEWSKSPVWPKNMESYKRGSI